jgi:hypothetical protein
MYLNQFKTQGIKDIFLVTSSLIFPTITGLIIIVSANSIFVAQRMEKRLQSLE